MPLKVSIRFSQKNTIASAACKFQRHLPPDQQLYVPCRLGASKTTQLTLKPNGDLGSFFLYSVAGKSLPLLHRFQPVIKRPKVQSGLYCQPLASVFTRKVFLLLQTTFWSVLLINVSITVLKQDCCRKSQNEHPHTS